VITAVAPLAADWNDSHIFNRRWPSHARFHGVVALTMTSTLAGLNLWSLWSGSTDRPTSRSWTRHPDPRLDQAVGGSGGHTVRR
jgi:hypothetical protein